MMGIIGWVGCIHQFSYHWLFITGQGLLFFFFLYKQKQKKKGDIYIYKKLKLKYKGLLNHFRSIISHFGFHFFWNEPPFYLFFLPLIINCNLYNHFNNQTKTRFERKKETKKKNVSIAVSRTFLRRWVHIRNVTW